MDDLEILFELQTNECHERSQWRGEYVPKLEFDFDNKQVTAVIVVTREYGDDEK